MLLALKAFGLAMYNWLESIVFFFYPKHLRYNDINKDTVLITGAGNGIGKLLALKMCKLVDTVVLWDVDQPRLKETASEVKKLGGKVKAFTCDLCSKDSVYKTAEQVKREVGEITMIINNAGIVAGKPFLELTDEAIQRTFDVNVMAHFWIIKSFLPDMMKRNSGHIVTMASVSSFIGASHLVDYSASKAAAFMLMEALYLELQTAGLTGIKFTGICPYLINTGMFHGARDKVISMLEPDYVSDKIIEAIRCNSYLLVMPRLFYFLIALKSLLPIKTGFNLYQMFGGTEMMKNFLGRNNNSLPNKSNHTNNSNDAKNHEEKVK